MVKYRTLPPGQVTLRLQSIPLPNKTKENLQKEFESWILHNGPEWAVERLKGFKSDLIKEFAGQDVSYSWFAKTSSKNLKGNFGSLRSLALHGKLEAVLNLLQISTFIEKPVLDRYEIKKIKASIESTSVPNWHRVGSRLSSAMKVLNLRCPTWVPWPVPLLQVPPSPLQFERIGNDLLCLSLPREDKLRFKNLDLEAIQNLYHHAIGGDIQNLPNPFPGILPGKVHFTPNPGLKARYFAVPNLILQRALDPLKVILLDALKKIPWDCTFAQSRADNEIQSHLRKGQFVHSIDLSNATDHFPWDFQKRVLRLFFDKATSKKGNRVKLNSMISLFEIAVEEGLWEFHLPSDPPSSSDYVRWKKGQPLGLGPSFPLFALSHGLLLFILNKMKWNQKFFILGDDIVILDDTLHRQYVKYLGLGNIPISEKKSISSQKIASFSGKIYLPNKKFYLPKWMEMNKKNLLDILAYWPYPKIYSRFKDKDLIDWVLSLPEPYGIGRNPRGIPFDERLTSEMMVELLKENPDRITRFATPSWQSIRPLSDMNRYYLQSLIRLKENYAWTSQDRQIYNREMLELLYSSGNPAFPPGWNPVKRSWSLGKISFWRRMRKHLRLMNPVET